MDMKTISYDNIYTYTTNQRFGIIIKPRLHLIDQNILK